MVSGEELEVLFKDATNETIVHLRYTTGRRPTARAIDEAREADDWNKEPDEFVGHFEGIRRTKKGEVVLTLFVHNRGSGGSYRTFNPSLGTIHWLRISN